MKNRADTGTITSHTETPKFRILFICTGFAGRSQMAEAFAREFAPGMVELTSAGEVKGAINPAAVKVMNEVGREISPEIEHTVEELKTAQFDIVVTLCNRARESCPVFPGYPARIHWSLDDPDNIPQDENASAEKTFRQVRDEIQGRIEGLFQHGYVESILQVRLTFGALIENIGDGVMAHDLDRRIFFFNEAAQEITGYDYSDVIGKDCHDVFPGRFCGGDCSFCENRNNEQSRLHYPRSFVRPDGEHRDFDMSVVTTKIPQGDVIGALITFRDMTEMIFLRRRLEETRGFHGIIGRHPSMLKVYEAISEIADINVPIIITGESGTDKEMIANLIHQQSSRSSGPFVPVNCGALPEGILESEMFGHVKGAFTGAVRNKKGRFELADGGTIFLDEIGEISQATQVKLLRAVQEKSFIPVGGEKTIRVDTRIICATNRDLKMLTQKGLFREDLFYRLAVIPIHLPTLRERISDIPLLVEHFLDKFSSVAGKRVLEVSSEAMNVLTKYRWPGNIRELCNAIQYALIKCHNSALRVTHLPPEIQAETIPELSRLPGRPPKLSTRVVENALDQAGGNKARTAKLLGVSRTTLYRFISKKKV